MACKICACQQFTPQKWTKNKCDKCLHFDSLHAAKIEAVKSPVTFVVVPRQLSDPMPITILPPPPPPPVVLPPLPSFAPPLVKIPVVGLNTTYTPPEQRFVSSAAGVQGEKPISTAKQIPGAVRMQHPFSLTGTPSLTSRPTRRLDLGGPPGFIVDDLLSPSECAFYISESTRAGYTHTSNPSDEEPGQGEVKFPASYRSHDRLMTVSFAAGRALFARLASSFEPEDIMNHPAGPHTSGIWLPCGLNELLKFARYSAPSLSSSSTTTFTTTSTTTTATTTTSITTSTKNNNDTSTTPTANGAFFAPHRDGPWAPTQDMVTVFTVVVYLNSCSHQENGTFEGGHTNFFRDGDTQIQTCSVCPRAGSALVFRHDALHEGAPVLHGTKYIIRTEVLFWRVPNALYTSTAALERINAQLDSNPATQHIAHMYEKSEALAEARDSTGFVKSYLSALDLQHSLTQHPLSTETHNTPLLLLPPKLLVHILSFLAPMSIGNLPSSFEALSKASRSCRLLYRVSRSCGLWCVSGMDTKRGCPPLLEGDERGPISPVSVDWFSVARATIPGGEEEVTTQQQQPPTAINVSKCVESALSLTSESESEQAILDELINDADYVRPFVVKLGSTNVSCQVVAEPVHQFPAVVGRARHSHGVRVGMGQKDAWIGDEALMKRGIMLLRYPVERGVITNWDDAEKLWHHAVYEQCRVAPEEHPMLVIEPIKPLTWHREKTAQLVFDWLNVPFLFIAQAPMMAVYASKSLTGVVVMIGGQVATVSPIYEGVPLPHAMCRLPFAGKDLDTHLRTLIKPRYDVTTSYELAVLRNVKETLCYVAQDYEAELEKPELDVSAEFEIMSNNYPDEIKTARIGRERFMIPELLFQPHLAPPLPSPSYNDSQIDPPIECVGLHEAVLTAIMNSGTDLQASLFNNIVLCGGTTQLKGLETRLLKELLRLTSAIAQAGEFFPSGIRRIISSYIWATEEDHLCISQDLNINIYVIADAVMRGGAKFAISLKASGLPSAPPKGAHWEWIPKEEYDEIGPSIHERCFW